MTDTNKSKVWLIWTGLFLAGMVVVVMLASGLGSSQALAPVEGVTITKSASVPSIEPGEVPAPVYTVVFSNSNDTDVYLESFTDTLPVGFVFITELSSPVDFPDPVYDGASEVVWDWDDGTYGTKALTLTAKSLMTIEYVVYVPGTVEPDFAPKMNEVVARAQDGTLIGPASAGIIVGAPALGVAKEASSLYVTNGEMVTYTVTISNSGQVTGTVTEIADTLDPILTFDSMTDGSDVQVVSLSDGNPVWSGPFELPPLETLTIQYVVQTPAGEEWQHPCNSVEVDTEDGLIGPAEVCITVRPASTFVHLPLVVKGFDFARFVVDKGVTPEAVVAAPNQNVTYEVIVTNVGETTGTLLTVEDKLPTGFVFQGMTAGSDVNSAPVGTTGTIVWEGPWILQPAEQLRLEYVVQASQTPGSYTNYADVTSFQATPPTEPASATVMVDVAIAGLTASNNGPSTAGSPTTLSASVTAGTNVQYTWEFGDGTTGSGASVQHVYPGEGEYTATVTAENSISQGTATTVVTVEPAVLLEENFSGGIGGWTPFLNYWRLEEGQWYWGSGDGVGGSGALSHNCLISNKLAEDALMMYLNDEAVTWTNYRVETKLLLTGGITENSDDEKIWIEAGGYPIGLWIRGQYQDVGKDDTAGWVTGYYIVVGGKPTKDTMFVRLAQLQTLTDCWDQACDNPGNLYDFNNPHTLAEVKLDQSFLRNKWYTLVVEAYEGHIKIWFDGQLAIDFVDPKEPFLEGTVGFKTFKSQIASFDDLVVTPLTEPLD